MTYIFIFFIHIFFIRYVIESHLFRSYFSIIIDVINLYSTVFFAFL